MSNEIQTDKDKWLELEGERKNIDLEIAKTLFKFYLGPRKVIR